MVLGSGLMASGWFAGVDQVLLGSYVDEVIDDSS